MAKNDYQKQSIYIPEWMNGELRALAKRTDRPLSWLLQQAWKIAKEQLQKMESVP